MKKLAPILLLFAALTARAEVIERVIAVVNDDIILQSDLAKYEKSLKDGAIVDDLLSTDPKALLKDRKALVDHMINEKVIDTEVKKRGLNVTFEQVEKEINKIASRNGISRTQLKQAIKEQGTNFSDYQDFIKKRLERQSLIEQSVTSKIKISDDEIATQYLSTKKKKSLNEAYEYQIAHILFQTGKDAKAAATKAQSVLALLKKGDSFETLASKYSEDPGFSAGGILGTFKSGEFVKELEDAVTQLQPGETSGIVKSKQGLHILKVISKRLIADPDLEKNKEEIRQVLYQKAFKKQFSFWLDQRRQEAFIRVNAK
ncbi:MAG: peptidylprolyl isomerase [Bdellovibrionia bacterium]